MRVVWIDLNCSYSHASLALPALHSNCPETVCDEWFVVSGTINEPLGRIVTEANRLAPDVIAATAWLFNHEKLMHILVRLRALLPFSTIILGGPEFLGNNERYLRTHPVVDFVFRGEGEKYFTSFLTCLEEASDFSHIKGLCYLENGKYMDNGLARIDDFSDIHTPEESSFFRWDKPFVQLETARGCFNTCAFCTSGEGRRAHHQSIKQIKQRLDIIHAHGIRDVRVLDRTFNDDALYAAGLLRLFATYAPHMRFHLEIHPALLTKEIRQVLREMPAGMLHLEAGIQSLQQEVLTACHRKGCLERSLDGLRFLCSLPNVETHADLIAGLPGYTARQLWEDVRMLASFHADEIQLEILKVLPGTPMREYPQEYGLCFSPVPPYEVLQTSSISADELLRAMLLSRLLDNFYNTSAWRGLTRQLIVAEEKFLSDFLTYLEEHAWADVPLSLEKRGLILYDYCEHHAPSFLIAATMAWVEAGMSLKKYPARLLQSCRLQKPVHWMVDYGSYHPSLRIYFLPIAEGSNSGFWYGYNTQEQCPKPVFKAFSFEC